MSAPFFWRRWGLPTCVAMALTPLALIAHSYKFVNDDQILYIPFLRRRLNASLYPGDYFFDQPQASISLFEDLLSWPVRWLGLEWTMLFGYLVAQLSILLGIYVLAKRLVSLRAAYLAMILAIMPVSVGGTFVRTYDNYLNPRTFTLPLGLLTLAALWGRRPWLAAILVSLHLLLHPLSGIHTWLVAALLFAWWAWKGLAPVRSLVGPSGLLLGVLGALVWSSGGSKALWLDPAWRAVLWQRTPYVFLGSWKGENWISLGLYLALGVLGWSSRSRDARTTQLSLAVLAVTLGATLVVALGVDWLGAAPLAQLQLARSWWLVIGLGLIFGADLLCVLYERGSWASLLAAASLGVVIYLNRADADWQPSFAVLLLAVLLARRLERVGGTWLRKGAEIVLALAGLWAVLPALLAVWSATREWTLLELAGGWRLPDEGLWPAILVLGLLLVVSRLWAEPEHTTRRWVEIAIGGGLILAAVWAGEWRQRDWSAHFNERLQLPTSETWMSPAFQAWRDVQLWAAVHTSPAARFVTDPDEKGFRVFSERSPIVEVKDGASAMFSRTYALEWERRMLAMAGAGVVDTADHGEQISFSLNGLAALHRLYPFEYVVGRQPQNLPWPEFYRNQEYVVYAWPGDGGQ